MAETSKYNPLGIVGLIGSILMIVGVFLTWAEVSAHVFGAEILNETFSGMDVYNGVDVLGDSVVMFDYNYAPIVALVAGVIALITTILPIFYNKKPAVSKALGIISLILAVVSIVITFLFYGQMDSVAVGGLMDASVSAGIGVWLAVAGAVILAIGGIIDIAKKYVTEGDA